MSTRIENLGGYNKARIALQVQECCMQVRNVFGFSKSEKR